MSSPSPLSQILDEFLRKILHCIEIQNKAFLVFTQRDSARKLQVAFFIPLFSRYLPFVIRLSFSKTERSVKTRKQNDHRYFGSTDTCSCHDNNVMLPEKSSPTVSARIVSLKLQSTPGWLSYFVRCTFLLPCRTMPDEQIIFRLN